VAGAKLNSKRVKHGPALPDWHLWGEVKRTVTPLRPERISSLATQLAETPLPMPEHRPPPVFDKSARWTGPSLPAYHPPTKGRLRTEPGRDIEPRMRRRLMRGRIDIDATIDLHGMRQAEARAALGRFVPARHARGDRTLLVITGKGLKKTDDLHILDRGVLRAMLPLWLSEPDLAPLIAGFDMAAQGHGGEGAFYVRLRRRAP
jgi:DNA-nicking Smr family endonuclease